MTEPEIIDAIRGEVSQHDRATPRAMELVELGVKEFPSSARLWILRGDLIQLSDSSPEYSLDEALGSYRTAVAIEPSNSEAHESIGHFLDAVCDQPSEAEAYFRKALELGGGKAAKEGLAQVLEQLGRSE